MISESPVVIDSVSDRAEVLLGDGRVIRVPGVAFPDEAQAVSAMRDMLREVSATMPLVSVNKDRWGRYSGQIAILKDGQMILLAERLIAQGNALLRTDDFLSLWKRGAASVANDCLKHLGKLEAAARADRLGIWGEMPGFPFDAKDTPMLQRHEGQFIVVQGEISSIGERQSMTFLNFGPSWRKDFSVMIPRKVWDKMIAEGMSSQALSGKSVLVRGHLMLRESALAHVNKEAGRAPHIRLLGTRDITIMDTD